LIARVWIAEELFYSNYPFLLPDFFRKKNTKDEFQVLKVFCSVSIQKFWVGRVWLAEELFYSKYPFLLPDFFKTKLTKDQFEVRVEVRKVFHSVEITKTFLIQQFLDSYSTVSNQRINKIKKNLIELVQLLQEYDLIESNYKIISNGSFLDTNELNISNISEGFVIYEKIYI